MKVNNCFCKTTTKKPQNPPCPEAKIPTSSGKKKNKKITGAKRRKHQGKLWTVSHNGSLFVASLPKKEKCHSSINNLFTIWGDWEKKKKKRDTSRKIFMEQIKAALLSSRIPITSLRPQPEMRGACG